MRVTNEIVIDADLETVWREFDNADNISGWQPTLKSIAHKSGTPGEPGAISELVYEDNGRDVVVTEMLTEKRKPYFVAGTYESPGDRAIIVNHFEAVDGGKTRWARYANHRFSGLTRILSMISARSVRERHVDDMQRFKLFVESRLAGGKK